MGKLMRFSWSWGYPNSWMVYNGRSYLKWMIWGYSLLGNRYMYIIYIHTWKMHRLMIPLELRSWKVAQYFTIHDELSFQKWKLCHGHPKLNPLLLISGIIPAFSQPQGSCFPTQEGLLEPTSADTQRKVENSNRLCSRWCSLYKSTCTTTCVEQSMYFN
jgi:hypothetical protein